MLLNNNRAIILAPFYLSAYQIFIKLHLAQLSSAF